MENNNIYWKGLEELNNSPEFEKNRYNEFAEKLPIGKVASPNDLEMTSTRRDFLKFMGFGITAATLAACARQPIKNAVPYAVKPDNVDPGIADWYASTCGGCGAGCSILVKSRDGRPTKIEGNPESPLFKGGVCAVGQAKVLSLYDLGRLSNPKLNKKDATWKELDTYVESALAEGGSIRILTGTINSPSTLASIEHITSKYPSAKHIQYDASSSSAIRLAHEKGFGKNVLPSFHFDKSKVVVSFGADFLGTWISPVEFTKQYTSKRNPDYPADFIQHFQFESNLSLTGSNADYRATLSPSQVGQALVRLHNLIAQMAGASTVGNSNIELAGNTLSLAAKQLWANKGKALVVSNSNDVDHQIIIAGINNLLGAYGSTINLENVSNQKMGNDKEMIQLVKELNAGQVNTLILMGCNPGYTYPKGFNEGVAKTKNTIALSTRIDETSVHFKAIAPDHHFLESWGDENPKSNYFGLYQPTISPIFNTRSAIESFLVWAGKPVKSDEFVKSVWKNKMSGKVEGSFDDFWNKTLETGFFALEESMGGGNFSADLSASVNDALKENFTGTKDSPELFLYEKVSMRDGKESNNPWLQELPDPVTKATWDNYIVMNPKMADELGVALEDVMEVKSNGLTMELPVLPLPGVKYGTIGVALGYGRGKDMTQDDIKVGYMVGKNAYPFATIANESIIYSQTKVNLIKTNKTFDLALTQTHHHMEGRDLVRETTLAEFASGKYAEKIEEKKEEAHHQHITLWSDYRFPGHRWGLAVDMNACTGCNACVVSCQAENNTPVVGKDEVRRRREMAWMRIDRYFALGVKEKGYHHHGHDVVIEDAHTNEFKVIDKLKSANNIDFEDVRVVFQPLMCQHCENASCESVCPVNAISHSSEGLNMQAYNRCVGTRYCANNCAFKVRRFNWFNYSLNDKFKDYTMQNDLGRMVLNPDVTVRTRGVMEKCTLCVQRIQTGKLNAKKENRAMVDGEVQTACSQSCPANAIVFGDLNNPNSEINKLLTGKRDYKILTELNVRPIVNYMTKVRNLESTPNA